VNENVHHKQWQQISRLLTLLVALAYPSLFYYLDRLHNWSILHTGIVAFVISVVFRAALDFGLRKFMPPPTLFGVDDPEARKADVVVRRRYWFWKFWAKLGFVYMLLVLIVAHKHHHALGSEAVNLAPNLLHHVTNPTFFLQGIQVIFLFAANFLIFMGPLIAMGVGQIKAYEPGDASWGVKLDDVRGQADAKEEIRRVVEIWQSGENFEKYGGKRERGMLFLGPPGVGKTFLAKAIATGFNAPFVTIPGSGFAQTFIGIDAVIVRLLARRAKKMARKWGGQCIVFIDEIDAVGRARSGVGGGQVLGPGGMFGGGGMGMGQMALNQLLVVMDSIDSPPFFRMFWTKKINLLLDATYFVPRKVGRFSLRLPTPSPRKDQVFWVGATNVPLEQLDPALVRAGRMGRHVYFRTPTKEDRKDVFDLYLKKVNHDPELDSPEKRDEIARITQGVSPASIEQICAMALTNAQNNGRTAFNYEDLVQALTTLEAGTAVGVEYEPDEALAVARHEAGHAAAAKIYRPEFESSRLSIKMRGSSLGHHQSFEKAERFSRWRSQDFNELIHGLAAMAAEYVFYGENGRGVGGDLGMATALAAQMTGMAGMTPYFTQVPETQAWIPERFMMIGSRLVNTSHPDQSDPIGVIMKNPDKRNDMYLFLGHSFVSAWNFIQINKDKVEAVAQEVLAQGELYGDQIEGLLDSQNFERFDYLDINNFESAKAWPVL
jgi:ATP-dependent Zn protease